MCLYSCYSYPACKSHILCAVFCCLLWPVFLYHIFPRFLINGTIFKKKNIEHKIVFWFFLLLLSETFLILRRIRLVVITNLHVFMKRTCYSCQMSTKRQFSRQIVEKYSHQISWFFFYFDLVNTTYKMWHSWNFVQWEPSWSMRRGEQTDWRT